MSDQPVTAPTGVERIDRRKSIGRYVKRLSTVLRRGSSSKNVSISEAPTTTATATEPADRAAASRLVPDEEPIAVTTSAGPSNVPGAYARSAVQQQRARELFAKYGLTLETHEWVTTSGATASVQRVEKPIRMRIHRTCHRCNTTFGTDRVCASCEHKRCTKCPRYPPKKTKDGAAKLDTEIEMESGKEDLAARTKKKPQLTMRTKTGGEVVYQPARQRIRRICHKCDSLFKPPTATICETCQHARCTQCPRDPAKTKKWPDGYPGDVPYEASDDEPPPLKPERTWKRPRLRVRWTCSECCNIFSDGLASCAHCGHDRCDKCIRVPPKKQRKEKEYDPEFVRQVEEKIRALEVASAEPREAEAASKAEAPLEAEAPPEPAAAAPPPAAEAPPTST